MLWHVSSATRRPRRLMSSVANVAAKMVSIQMVMEYALLVIATVSHAQLKASVKRVESRLSSVKTAASSAQNRVSSKKILVLLVRLDARNAMI